MGERTCPTCGRPWSPDDEQKRLLNTLRQPVPGNNNRRREVYRAAGSDEWFVTRGGGPFHKDTVMELVSQGIIRPVYDNTNDAYYEGRTVDTERTFAARRAGDKYSVFYVDDAP